MTNQTKNNTQTEKNELNTESLTINEHLKNQLNRNIEEWMYSGLYGLDFNFYSGLNLWTEIKESDYWYMLECMPPLKFDGSNFLVCEPLTYKTHACLIKVNDRFFGKYMNIEEYNINSYSEYIKEVKLQYNI